MGAPVGNQNGKKAKRWSDALNRALARAAAGEGVEAGLDKVADQVVAAALTGDKDAWKEIGDRQDGKVAQSLTLAGDPEAPLQTVSKVELAPLK